MVPKERFLRTLRFEPVDRAPLMEIAVWAHTRQRWIGEGMPEAVDIAKLILGKMNLEKFRGHTVLDKTHLPPGQDWTEFLWTEMIVYWLWAYWLGRHRKLW